VSNHSSRTKTPIQALLKSENSSVLSQNKDLTMGIYGTGLKGRSKSKALKKSGNTKPLKFFKKIFR